MSSQHQGKTDGGGGHPNKPNMNQVMNRLLDYSRQNPDIKFTTEDFADALRKVALRKQAAELMNDMTSVPVDIASAHDSSATVPNTSTETPESSTNRALLSLRPRGGTAGHLVPPVALPPAPAPILAPAPALVPSQFSVPTQILTPGPGFAAASSVIGNRKPPPPALNLELLLSRATRKPAPNHYIALPATKPGNDVPSESVEDIERVLNYRTSPAKQIVLLKSPIPILSLDNKEKKKGVPPIGDCSVEPIPQASQETANLSTDFTLETPLTSKFAKEKIELKKSKQIKDEDSASIYSPNIKILLEHPLGGVASKDKKGKAAKSTHRRTTKNISRFYRLHLALNTGRSRVSKRFDMIAQLSTKLELVVEVCKHLPPADLLNLYSIHRSFHVVINHFLRSSIQAWTDCNCPEAALAYNWHSAAYRHLTIPDPAGRPLTSPLTPYGFHPFRPQPKKYKPSTADNEYLEGKGIDTSSRKGKEKMVYPEGDTKPDGKSTGEEEHTVLRLVPTLKWYAMCYTRQETVEDILAHLARRGHRTPPGTFISLLKLWKLMASPTNDERREIIRSDSRNSHNIDCKCYILEAKALLDQGKPVAPLRSLEKMAKVGALGVPEAVQGFTDLDLLRIQCFFLKLDLRFNDPIYGPEDTDLSHLMLGQRSLVPLRQMLFGERYRTIDELMALKMRYDLGCTWTIFTPARPETLLRQNWGVMGVPFADWGKSHLEYWGERSGGPLSLPAVRDPMAPPPVRSHLMHVSQLVAEESVRRDLRLEEHLLPLLLWGSFDWKTGRNLCPTEAEIALADAAHKTRHVDTSEEFTRVEILKSRWGRGTLTAAERREVLAAQLRRDDLLRKWDNNQLWDPLQHTEHDDETVQLSYAITQSITGRGGPPLDPTRSSSTAPQDDDDEDEVGTPGPVTAEFLRRERMSDSDFDEESDTDSEPSDDDNDDDHNNNNSSWKPRGRDEYQVPQSFKQSLANYQWRQRRAALAANNHNSSSRNTGRGPRGPTSSTTIYCGHSPLLPDPDGDGGNAAADEEVIDEEYINDDLHDLEEQLSDGDTEPGVENTWDDFDWNQAPGCMWGFLRRVDLDDHKEDDVDEAAADPFSVPTTSAAAAGAGAGAGASASTDHAATMEETIEAAWAALQEAEEEALAAGYRSIPARHT